MKPKTQIFDIGSTVHGQPLELIYDRDSKSFSIYRGQGDQKDDTAQVYGIPKQVLIDMAAAAQTV